MRHRSGLEGLAPRYSMVGPPFCSTTPPGAGQCRVAASAFSGKVELTETSMGGKLLAAWASAGLLLSERDPAGAGAEDEQCEQS